MSRIRANQITNQSADGAPTVQNGLVISGVTTSTTFSGSGASLTNIPSAQLTGALPAISGANLTGITQTAINNNANNRVITGSGTANTLEGESTLTYNGSTLIFADTSGDAYIQYGAHSTIANNFVLGAQGDGTFRLFNGTYASGTERLRIGSDGKIDVIGGYIARNPSDSFTLNGVNTPHYGFQLNASSTVPIAMSGYYGISFATTGVERLRIAKTTGDVTVNTGNLVIGTSGKGIDFSATYDGSNVSGVTATSELLSDYEEGTFQPLLKRLMTNNSTETSFYTQGTRAGNYTRIGDRVWITGAIYWNGGSTGSGSVILTNLPFTVNSGTANDGVPLVVGFRSGWNYRDMTGYSAGNMNRFYLAYYDSSGTYNISPGATATQGTLYFSANYELV